MIKDMNRISWKVKDVFLQVHLVNCFKHLTHNYYMTKNQDSIEMLWTAIR